MSGQEAQHDKADQAEEKFLAVAIEDRSSHLADIHVENPDKKEAGWLGDR